MMASAHSNPNPHINIVSNLDPYGGHFTPTPMYHGNMLPWVEVPGLSLVPPPHATHSFQPQLQTVGAMRENMMTSPVVPPPPAPQVFPPSTLPLRSTPLERRESSFRPSKYEFEAAPTPSRPFQTSAFEQ